MKAGPDPTRLEQSSAYSPGMDARHIEVAGHQCTIFTESPPLIAAMVKDIANAQARVWLETYIFADDGAGRTVARALKEKARAGLDVRVLYDTIGCLTTPSSFFRDLQRANVHVHAFHSFGEALWRFSLLRILNRRDHRKLLIIDQYVAYFGGMNVVDASSLSSLRHAEGMPISAGWRDVHIRLVGPQQKEVAESFERSWKRARREKVPARSRSYRLGQLAAGAESIQFFDSGPGPKNTRAVRIFMRLIREARQSLIISMAYFLPLGRVLTVLLRARRRGVVLRVVVPAESDVALVRRATRHLYQKFLRRRFHLYQRQNSMLHGKVMIVDNEWCVVGSCNLDARSLWINLEFLAVIHSPALARVLAAIVKDDIAQSHRIRLREYRRRGWWQRFLDRLAWTLRWWL
jgi:cardiolipin synthase